MPDNKFTFFKGQALTKEKYGVLPYFPSKETIDAVNVARLLNRPLLINGEPGCGKTRLGEAIAVEVHGKDWKDHLYYWPIRSTSKAQQGLYVYDHLAELRDAQKRKRQRKDPAKSYVRLQSLGKAIQQSTPEKPEIVIIDEIDKADIDFPNDLLDVLEKKSFEILELPENHRARKIEGPPPFILITSNNEKELSNPFLRRCVFLLIDFPTKDKLLEITRAYFPGAPKDWLKEHLDKLVSHFLKIRKDLEISERFRKLPSTSELLDWTKAIGHYSDFGQDQEALNDILQVPMIKDKLLFKETLLKTEEDQKGYKASKTR